MANYTRKATSCSVDGCTAGGYMSRGLCKTHYARLLRHGDPGAAELQHAVSYEGQVCATPECDRVPKARGLCLMHYKREWKRATGRGPRPVAPAPERFAQCVRVGSAPPERPALGPCHEWAGTRMPSGYGVFTQARRDRVLAHRWAYAEQHGSIPDGLVIDHLCRNRACVNPAHLEPVTNEENLRRGAGYGLQNGMRSACIHGHEYTPKNTYTAPDGGIRCRTCMRASQRRRSQKNG